MNRVLVSIASLALCSVACSTVRYQSVEPPAGKFFGTHPVVGVVEPLAYLDPDQPLYGDGELWTFESEADLKASAHLIQLLRDTGLFAEVDFLCQLSSQPDVAVSAISEPWTRTARETSELTFYYWFLTFGIVPWVETRDFGVGFSIVGQAREPIVLTHEETSVVGWAALFMNLLPQWHLHRAPQARSNALARVLARSEPSIFDPDHWLSDGEVGRLTSRCS